VTGPFSVRPLAVADLAELASASAEALADWSAEQLARELERANGWQFVVEARGRAVGFVCGQSVVDEAEILQLGVVKGARRHGVASLLLEYCLGFLAARGINRCFLELRRANRAAEHLYLKYGFRRVGLRKNYYATPVEDAIIMEKVTEGNIS